MKFRLRRYFLLTSLPVVVIITLLSAYGYISFATSILVEQESHASQQQTRVMSQLLWPRFQSHIMWSKDQDAISLSAAQAVAAIDEIVLDLFRGSNVCIRRSTHR